jgi:hypothetical protein
MSTLGTGILAATGASIVGSLIVGGTPVVTNIVQGLFNFSLIKNRKKKYRTLVEKLSKYKHELFMYHQKALKDEILTDEEIETSKIIINKAKNVILKIKEDNIKETNANFDPELINKFKNFLDEMSAFRTPEVSKVSIK